MSTNNTQITSHQRHLLHQTVFEMAKHRFLPRQNTDDTIRFERPNSSAAMKLTTEGYRVVIRKDFTGPLMLGEPFIRKLIGSGLYTFATVDGECILISC